MDWRLTAAEGEWSDNQITLFEPLDPLPNFNDLPEQLMSKGESSSRPFCPSVEV